MEVDMETDIKTVRAFGPLSNQYLLIVIFYITVTMGCAMNTAKIEPDNDIAGKFKNAEAIPGYRYFHYSIGGYKTYAIVGLAPGYTLESRLWEEYDPGTGEFKKLVDQLTTFRRSRASGHGQQSYLGNTNGFRLLDVDGRALGVLYTNLGTTAIFLKEGNRVFVSLEVPGKRGAP